MQHRPRPDNINNNKNDVKDHEDSNGTGEAVAAAVSPSPTTPWNFERVYVSPLTRTLMTAAPLVAGFCGTEPSSITTPAGHSHRSAGQNNGDGDNDDAVVPNGTTCPSFHVIPTIFENGGCFVGSRQDPVRKTPPPPSELKHGLNRDEMLNLLLSECRASDDGDDNRKDDGDDDSKVDGAASLPVVLPDIVIDPGCTEDRGWWKGGRESDRDYFRRCFSVVDWLWKQDKDCMLITHGIFIDTLTKILLNVDNIGSMSFLKEEDGDEFLEGGTLVDGGDVPKLDSFDSYFLSGNVSISCFNFDQERRKVGVCFLNQPVIDPEVRTGHSLGGIHLRHNEW